MVGISFVEEQISDFNCIYRITKRFQNIEIPCQQDTDFFNAENKILIRASIAAGQVKRYHIK